MGTQSTPLKRDLDSGAVMHDAVNSMADFASHAGDIAKKTGAKIQDTVAAIPGAIRSKPYQALAIGFGSGILLGLALKRRLA